MATTTDVLTDWLTPSQAARRAERSAMRIRQLADDGTLVSRRGVMGRLIEPASLDRWLAARAPAPGRRGPAAPVPHTRAPDRPTAA